MAAWSSAVFAQTPSPFAYWQNAAGVVLAPLGGPVPEWQVSLGAGAAYLPAYEGSTRYVMDPAPVIDVRYRDLAFLSLGDGLGVNLIRGDTYRVGLAVGYDVGRSQHLSNRLNGLGSIGPAAVPRIFGEVAILPVVLTADLRHPVGAQDGLIGDIGAYVPVIGNENLVVFAGPSVTFADQRDMQTFFGVSTAQSLGSKDHFSAYTAQAGLRNAILGVTAIYHFTDNLFTDASITWERLAGSAGNSPIVQSRDNFGLSLTVGYEF